MPSHHPVPALRPAAALLLSSLAVVASAPPDAEAQTGAAPASGPSGGQSSTDAARAPEAVRVHSAPARTLAGREVKVRGALSSGRRGRPVLLQLRTERGWRTVDRSRTARGGSFRVGWRAQALGRHALRAVAPRAGARGVPGRPRVVRVFRASLASWFGPGFYGRRTACGRTLAPGMLGVAHKRLPCGTRVTFAHGRRSVTVPVIDRGPFVGSREWDLTAAARQKLALPSTAVVWSSH